MAAPAHGPSHRRYHHAFRGSAIESLLRSMGAAASRLPTPAPVTAPLRLWLPSRCQPHGRNPTRNRALPALVFLAEQLHSSTPRTSGGCIATAGCGPCNATGRAPPLLPTHIGGSARSHSGVLLCAVPARGSRAVATAVSRGAWQPAVVIVESPTKAKKIQGFLGDQYKVLASYGHVRDLPSRKGSVLPDQDFALEWRLLPGAGPRLEEIAGAAAGAPVLLLATDPDREGEAISWHIEQELRRRGVLQRVGAVQRITFTEITRSAVTSAMRAGRQVSQPLVDAYLARRALDYLVGFNLSPVLWRKLPGARSAGRVQSVALRLVCEREAQVERFTSKPYWSLQVELSPPHHRRQPQSGFPASHPIPVVARLTHVDGRRLGPLDISSRDKAEELARRIKSSPVVVSRVSRRQLQRHPSPPFTTASLQQEASRRLGFGAAKTMRVAQQLYEGAGTGEGLITYMRTDGVQMAAEAVAELRLANKGLYGKDAVPPEPWQYKGRAKNAQEAHEAIRPTQPAVITPASMPDSLDSDQRALYELIWRRAVASQMVSAVYDVVTAEFTADGGTLTLCASGSMLKQPGFLRAFDDIAAQDSEEEDEAERQQQQQQQGSGSTSEDEAALGSRANNRGVAAEQLLSLQVGSAVQPAAVLPCRHLTRPPPRFTEASLVRALEERGIGRPSTYAPIMSLLQDRGYVVREGRALVPTALGRVLTAFLQLYFPTYVDVEFTSDMEGRLDDVASGKTAWRAVLSGFWAPFDAAVAAMSAIRTAQVYDRLDAELESYLFPHTAPLMIAGDNSTSTDTTATTNQSRTIDVKSTASGASATALAVPLALEPVAAVADPRQCPKCGMGRLVLKPSRYGGFVGCSRYSDPEARCDFARPLMRAPVVELAAATTGTDSDGEVGAAGATERLLGRHPETGEPVWARLGPYGLYVQLGDSPLKAAKEKKRAKRGRKATKGAAPPAAAADEEGPEGSAAEEAEEEPRKPKRAAIPKAKGLTLHSVSLSQALALLSLPRDLGRHPQDGLPVIANSGPFGPYVAHNGLSASLGRSVSVQEVDLAAAVQLLAAKRLRLAAREAEGLPPNRPGRRLEGKSAAGAARQSATRGGRAKATAVAKSASAASASPKSSGSGSSSTTSSSSSPARSKTGYTVYLQQRWQHIKATEGGQVPYRQAVSRIAADWRALGEEGQRRFQEGVAAEPPPPPPPPSHVLPTNGRTWPSTSGSASATAAAPADPPSRTNPYLRFCHQRRPELRSAHRGASLGELSRMLGAEWGAMSEQQKAAFR